jgi:hypothetical protein
MPRQKQAQSELKSSAVSRRLQASAGDLWRSLTARRDQSFINTLLDRGTPRAPSAGSARGDGRRPAARPMAAASSKMRECEERRAILEIGAPKEEQVGAEQVGGRDD